MKLKEIIKNKGYLDLLFNDDTLWSIPYTTEDYSFSWACRFNKECLTKNNFTTIASLLDSFYFLIMYKGKRDQVKLLAEFKKAIDKNNKMRK